MAWFGVSSGVLYTVGDIHGWSNHSDVNYKTWASSKQFHIGDFIRKLLSLSLSALKDIYFVCTLMASRA